MPLPSTSAFTVAAVFSALSAVALTTVLAEKVTLPLVQDNESGCPSINSVTAWIENDGSESSNLHIRFTELETAAGRNPIGNYGTGYNYYKSCKVSIPVPIPIGHQYGIASTQIEGKAYLDQDTSVRFSNWYSFDTGATEDVYLTVQGPRSARRSFNVKSEESDKTLWSPCHQTEGDGNAVLTYQTKSDAWIELFGDMDRKDAHLYPTVDQTLKLVWRKC
ncbi:hypothetical protein HK102_013027 [Quaeritorhiza haematococci]|nr:hypothetical protein HK102_013027 [Quaeritorhiza haematococci]